MLTSQAFRDYFPSSPSLPSQGCRSLFKRLTLQFFPWWLCNRPELLAQPPTMGSSLKSVAWLPLLWTCRRPLATRGIAHSTRTEILTHSTRISHIRNFVQPTFHLLRISHIRNSVRPTFHILRISHIRRLSGRRSNFSG